MDHKTGQRLCVPILMFEYRMYPTLLCWRLCPQLAALSLNVLDFFFKWSLGSGGGSLGRKYACGKEYYLWPFLKISSSFLVIRNKEFWSSYSSMRNVGGGVHRGWRLKRHWANPLRWDTIYLLEQHARQKMAFRYPHTWPTHTGHIHCCQRHICRLPHRPHKGRHTGL